MQASQNFIQAIMCVRHAVLHHLSGSFAPQAGPASKKIGQTVENTVAKKTLELVS